MWATHVGCPCLGHMIFKLWNSFWPSVERGNRMEAAFCVVCSYLGLLSYVELFVFPAMFIFVSLSQMFCCQDHLRNNLNCIKWKTG